MTHSAAFAGFLRRRPPHSEVQLDLTLRNPDGAPRWAIVADTLGEAPRPGRVTSLDAYELAGTGRVVALRGLAMEGFFAVLLEPASEVVLRGLPLAHHGALPERAEVEVVLASALLAGGEPPRLPLVLESEPGAAGDAAVLAGQEAVTAVQAGPLEVTWDVDARSRVPVTLG